MTPKKNILMIVYAYPPIKAVGSLRPYFFSKCLKEAGWDVHVFSTTNSRLLDTDRNYERLVFDKKVDLPTLDLMTLRYLGRGLFKKRGASGSGAPSGNPGPVMYAYAAIRRFIRKLIRSFPFNIFYGGGLIFIISGLIKGMAYIRRHNIEYIYTTFSPYSVSVTAFLLKLFNRRLIWVADFRDLLPEDSDEKVFLPQLQRWFNRIIFRRADSIVAISEGLGGKLTRYNKNVKIIRNGIPLDARIISQAQPDTREKTFNITYTGRLYYGRRDATLLFRVVRKLLDKNEIGDDIRLVYAGIEDNVWRKWADENGLLGNIELLGSSDRDTALVLQNWASINLVLTWSTEKEKGIITAKFYEYLASGKPVICIVDGQRDKEVEKLYESINAGIVVNNTSKEEERLAFFIKVLYGRWKAKGGVDWEYNEGFIDALKYENLSRELGEICIAGKIASERRQDAV